MRVMVAATESHETQRNGANHWASMRAGMKGAPDPAAEPESRVYLRSPSHVNKFTML
jgi:hypothetical protein